MGGIASVLGGGKFANGAVTAAFSYAAGASHPANDNPDPNSPYVQLAANTAPGAVQSDAINAVPSDAQVGWFLGGAAAFFAPELKGLYNLGQTIWDLLPSGYGDLSNGEVNQIQNVVNQAGRPLDVVGSAAQGARTAGSDIDYTTANSNIGNFEGLEQNLPGMVDHSLLRGAPEGPSIRFEPYATPKYNPGPP